MARHALELAHQAVQLGVAVEVPRVRGDARQPGVVQPAAQAGHEHLGELLPVVAGIRSRDLLDGLELALAAPLVERPAEQGDLAVEVVVIFMITYIPAVSLAIPRYFGFIIGG